MDRGAWWATVQGVPVIGNNLATKLPPRLAWNGLLWPRHLWNIRDYSHHNYQWPCDLNPLWTTSSAICWNSCFVEYEIHLRKKKKILTQVTVHDESKSRSVMSDSLQPNGIVHVILQARILEWIANPGLDPRSPSLQADSLPAEPQGKPTVHDNRC